ncbi:MAG: Maf family protein [Wenzhouxiangella sp.]
MTDSSALPGRLILASGSIYRRQMLARLGIDFEVIPADIDESSLEGEDGQTLARRLAAEKSAVVAALHPDAIVIGADQVAECRGRQLGKPGSAERALEQLQFCRGHDIVFHSAIAVRQGKRLLEAVVPTHVSLKPLDDAALTRYIERDKPFDCAGSMRSESLGITLTSAIRSDDPTALIGMPLITIARMLTELGFRLP